MIIFMRPHPTASADNFDAACMWTCMYLYLQVDELVPALVETLASHVDVHVLAG